MKHNNKFAITRLFVCSFMILSFACTMTYSQDYLYTLRNTQVSIYPNNSFNNSVTAEMIEKAEADFRNYYNSTTSRDLSYTTDYNTNCFGYAFNGMGTFMYTADGN